MSKDELNNNLDDGLDAEDFELDEDVTLGVGSSDESSLDDNLDDDLDDVEVEDDGDIVIGVTQEPAASATDTLDDDLDDFGELDDLEELEEVKQVGDLQLGVKTDLTAEELEEQERKIDEVAKKLEQSNFIRLEQAQFESELDDFLLDDDNLDDLNYLTQSAGLALGFEVTKQMLISDNSIKEQQLMLGMGTADVSEERVEHQKFEVALSPREHVLAIYEHTEDDVYSIRESNRDISDWLSGANRILPEARKRIEEHLTLPEYDLIPKKFIKFRNQYRKYDHVRKYLTIRAENHYYNPNAVTMELVFSELIDIWDKENLGSFNSTYQKKIFELVRSFFQFSTSVLREAERERELVAYEPPDVPSKLPELITNTHYICSCDSELAMPGDRPTLCTFIHKIGKSVSYRLMNEEIYCVKCAMNLVLPLKLVQQIEDGLFAYIKSLNVNVDQFTIYRPKSEILKTFIPSDHQEYFNLDIKQVSSISSSTTASKLQTEALTSYKRLISYWMEPVKAEYKAEALREKLDFSEETGRMIELASLVRPTGVTELEVFRFTKTMLLFLEGYGLFNITEQKKAFATVIDVEKLEQQNFDDEYALAWMWKFAPMLASLNNLYDDLEVTSLYIRKEFVEVITHINALRHVSRPENLKTSKLISGWFRKPEGKDGEKLANRVKDNSLIPKYLALPRAKRDMMDTKYYYDPKSAWMSYFHFMTSIVDTVRFKPDTPAEIRQLLGMMKRSSFKAFTGLENDLLDYLVPPTPNFEEFKKVFMEYGHLLFQGVFVDETIKNIAKAVTILHLDSKLSLTSQFVVEEKPVIDPSAFMPVEPDYGIDGEKLFREKLIAKVILDLAVLPEPFHSRREEFGAEDIPVESLIDDPQELVADRSFFERYKEVIPCILLQNTTNA